MKLRPNINILVLSLTALVMASCGKAIQATSKAVVEDEVSRRPISSNVLFFANDGSSFADYVMPAIGKVYIPPAMEHIAGDAQTRTKLHFNEGDSTAFFCEYGFSSAAEDETTEPYQLLQCVSNAGVMSLQGGDSVVLYEGETISIERSGAFATAEIEIIWH